MGLTPVGESLSGLGPVDGALRDPAHPCQGFLGQAFHTKSKKLDHSLGVVLTDGGGDLGISPYPRRNALADLTAAVAGSSAVSTTHRGVLRHLGV
ncbi:hypothetical protein GCM10009642_64540 [Nocardiopsis metallicus]